MVEGARLEGVFTRKGNVGSNPTRSASFFSQMHIAFGFFCITQQQISRSNGV